jgi:hypothetical protein
MSSRDLSVPVSGRRLVIEVVVVAIVVFVAYAWSRPDSVATLGRLYDDVVYLSVGRSIANGTGYHSVHLVGSPVHVKFPPLLPSIYALGWQAFGTLRGVAAYAMWLNIVITAASAAILWWFARRVLAVSAVTTGLFVLAPVLTDRTMFYFSGATSEPWMLLGWCIALVLVQRLERHEAAGRGLVGVAVALGLVLALTVLARTQAIAVASAILLGLAVARLGARALVAAFLSMAIPLVAWKLSHGSMMARGPLSTLPDQVSYTSWIPTNDLGAFVTFVGRMVRISAPLYGRNTADLLMGYVSLKTLLLGAGFIVCGLVGVALVMRRWPALGLSVVAMIGVLAIWPYVQDRFLTPVLPVLGLAAAYGVDTLLATLNPTVRRAALGMAGLVALLIFGVNARARIDSARGAPGSPFAHAVSMMVRWIDANTAPRDHIMVSWGGAIYLRTGRQTSIPDPEEATLAPSVYASPNRFLAGRILADSVDHVIIWDRAPGRAGAALRNLATACPGLMTETPRDSIVASSDLHIYRVRRDVPCLNVFATSIPQNDGTGNKNAP